MSKRKKIKNMTKFVIVSIIALVVFTVACFFAIFNDKEIPDSLIVSFFAAFTGELAGLMYKKVKDKKNDTETGG